MRFDSHRVCCNLWSWIDFQFRHKCTVVHMAVMSTRERQKGTSEAPSGTPDVVSRDWGGGTGVQDGMGHSVLGETQVVNLAIPTFYFPWKALYHLHQ